MFATIHEAEAITHTLSSPSKMPCHGYSIPAIRCIVGSKLRKIANSVCSICYALKGRYVFPNVLEAMEKRFQSLMKAIVRVQQKDEWIEAMVFLISKKEKSGFFRWHDSGDLQGVWHLEIIAEVARRLPQIKFWLPTREYSFVSEWIQAGNKVPENLTIRLSALMLDGEPPKAIAERLNLTVSGASDTDWNCPASLQSGKCGDCRNCWDRNVQQVNYKKH